jgi:hypothetical protein
MQRTTHAAIIIFERKPVQMNHSVFSRKFLVGKLTLLVVLYGLVFTSCEVIVDFGLKDATFELQDARIPDQFEGSVLFLLFPGYQANNPDYRYMIHFYDGDRCTGTYYAADTVNYEVEGTWSLPQHDVLRIDLDQYVNGDFLMTKLEKDLFFLTSDENYINIIQPDTIPLNMYIKRYH